MVIDSDRKCYVMDTRALVQLIKQEQRRVHFRSDGWPVSFECA